MLRKLYYGIMKENFIMEDGLVILWVKEKKLDGDMITYLVNMSILDISIKIKEMDMES